MATDYEKTLGIIFGRWKSHILYAGVKLGIFDYIASAPEDTSDIAEHLGLDPTLTYRLLRALSSLGFLKEEDDHRFSISRQGKLLQKNQTQTLIDVTLLEEGPEHYDVWKHLPAMIKDGQQNAFLREYGIKAFEFAGKNPEYAKVFSQAMTSYSATQTILGIGCT